MMEHPMGWPDTPNIPTYALLSGGHDSICATHLAATTLPQFKGVIHIDTGTGIPETQKYVKDVCAHYNWPLIIQKPFMPYVALLMKYGFPGPAMHGFFYQMLKERPLRQVLRQLVGELSLGPKDKIGLVSGARKHESARRAQIKDVPYTEGRKYWIPIIADWTTQDCNGYIDRWAIPRNPVKDKLGMSGECLCGAYAQKDEFALINHHYPDTGHTIKRWEELVFLAYHTGIIGEAIESHHCRWGHAKGMRVSDDQLELPGFEVGEMCSTCNGKTDRARLKLGLDI